MKDPNTILRLSGCLMKRKRLHFETIPQKRLDFVRKKQYAFVHRLTNKEDFDNFGIIEFFEGGKWEINVIERVVSDKVEDHYGLPVITEWHIEKEETIWAIPSNCHEHGRAWYTTNELILPLIVMGDRIVTSMLMIRCINCHMNVSRMDIYYTLIDDLGMKAFIHGPSHPNYMNPYNTKKFRETFFEPFEW